MSLPKISRRHLIVGAAALAAAAASWKSRLLNQRFNQYFPPDFSKIPVRMIGSTSGVGHLLRDKFQFPAPEKHEELDTVIVGSGIAGLSAGWRLSKKGHKKFKVLELEPFVGGTSASDKNRVSEFPLGAHYTSLLNQESAFAQELFEDIGVIIGSGEGLPIYNEEYLCHQPYDRLFIDGEWQEGLYPRLRESRKDHHQRKQLREIVNAYRNQKRKDGRVPFAIPIDLSSQDPELLELDKISMADWLTQIGLDSRNLRWYIDQCCRDDYGMTSEHVSAWAGLHYHCSRQWKAANVKGPSVLTWPEGNGWIVKRIREKIADHVQTDSLVYKVETKGELVEVYSWDTQKKISTLIRTKNVILATPRFVSARLLQSEKQMAFAKEMSYSPWAVANILLKHIPRPGRGEPITWDNIFFQGKSVGYVIANHHNVATRGGPVVMTCYQPLDESDPVTSRNEARNLTAEDWRDRFLGELVEIHPDLPGLVECMDVCVWGHGMIRPTTGFIWGETREALEKSEGRVHFAHSDMSGIAIFEEANYRGVRAADKILNI